MARRLREDALETREKLLESALDIMSSKPFPNVTMTEIAQRVDLSKGAIYWHFRNKTDVLVSLIENSLAQLEKMLCSNMTSLESIDDLCGYFKNKVENLLRSEKALKVNRLICRREEWPEDIRTKVMAILLDGMERERREIEKLLAAAQDGGTLRRNFSPRRVALLISAIFQGLFICQMDGFFPDDSRQYTDFIFDAFKKELDPTNDTGVAL